ncbi:hypothetical protein TNCV_1857781 [Trichonephila clavipes]|nr:hypothetical protein TNCV_1857781 [Trichonephila clavipes]
MCKSIDRLLMPDYTRAIVNGNRNSEPWSAEKKGGKRERRMQERKRASYENTFHCVKSSCSIVPLKTHRVEEPMYIKYLEIQSPSVGMEWKLGEWDVSSGVVLVP